MTDAVILAGGKSDRLKWETSVCKPLLRFGKDTLLSLQTKWLLSKGFSKVHIVCSQEVSDGIDEWILANQNALIHVEQERRGTAGAIAAILPQLSQIFYAQNVDDLVLESEPMNLILKAEKFAGVILAGKPKSSFGVLQTRGDLVLNFSEKPVLKDWMSCGHYAFHTSRLNNGLYFPANGNLEETLLPELAERRKLAVEKYRGTWITISNMKDYLEACERLSNQNH